METDIINTLETKLEALGILQEECAEVIKIASKIRRFDETGLHKGRTARSRFIQEIGDVLAMISIIQNMYSLPKAELDLAIEQKFEKLKKYSSIFIAK